MRAISVFTPIHKYNPEFLTQLIMSLKGQTYMHFEWIVLLNGEAKKSLKAFTQLIKKLGIEDWTRIHLSDNVGNIGILKGECCALATGEILVELDHDDYLSSDALEVINETFEDPEIVFAYSNCFIYWNDCIC